MARNAVQFQKGYSLGQFFAEYGTEDQCAEALERWRWPNGFVCPQCHYTRYCTLHCRALVNLDGNAAPLAEHLEPLKRQLSGYDLDSLVHVRRIFSEPIEANWKLIIENYMEPYHVPFVHAATTQGQPLEDHACITDGNCVGSYVKVDNPLPRQGNGAPAVTSAPDSLDTSAHYLDLFPNFGISTFRDALIAVLMVPQSPQRTLWQLDLYFYGHMAKDPEVIDNWSNLMHAVFYEDKAII